MVARCNDEEEWSCHRVIVEQCRPEFVVLRFQAGYRDVLIGMLCIHKRAWKPSRPEGRSFHCTVLCPPGIEPIGHRNLSPNGLTGLPPRPEAYLYP